MRRLIAGSGSSIEAGRARPAATRAFTLIELLVVLVILGLLASLVGPQVMKHLGDSKTKTAMLQIEELSTALDIYKLENGTYPTGEEGLRALVEKPANLDTWSGPYLKKQVLRNDPWGHEYQYRFPGEHGPFDLYSLGADHAVGGGGEDRDVSSWE